MVQKHAVIMAGIADQNASLFRRLKVPLGDPAAWIEIDNTRTALVRDLEMDRVAEASEASVVTCPADHPPPTGLSPDRETATAEAAAQILRRARVSQVIADRTLPLIFAWHLEQAEVEVRYDSQLGVADRRGKTVHEIEALRRAQRVTEDVMRQICESIATSDVDDHGFLISGGKALTADSIRATAAIEFLRRGFTMAHGAIVAQAPEVADCHHRGEGPLRTGQSIIVDLFPRDESSRFWGDCTRTVVHGEIPATVVAMHAAVVEAKAAATAALRPGATAADVHAASDAVLKAHGFADSRGRVSEAATIQHGTGHGIGLDLHEPILLDVGGGEIVDNEVFTIEPGLYGRRDGGVRIEDMVVAREDGPENLNRLSNGLTWN